MGGHEPKDLTMTDTAPVIDLADSQINALGGMTPEQVRLEALKLATKIVCQGNWEGARQRCDMAVTIAEAFVGFIAPPPSDEAAADALAVERRA